MWKTLASLLLATVAMAPVQRPATANEKEEARYAVYGAALNIQASERLGHWPHSRPWTILPATERDTVCLPTVALPNHPWQATIDDYLRQIKPEPVRSRAPLLLPNFRLRSLQSLKTRDVFIALSNVGFNPTLTQAIVHLRLGCKLSDCGEGRDLLLEKVDGKWMGVSPDGLVACQWIA